MAKAKQINLYHSPDSHCSHSSRSPVESLPPGLDPPTAASPEIQLSRCALDRCCLIETNQTLFIKRASHALGMRYKYNMYSIWLISSSGILNLKDIFG